MWKTFFKFHGVILMAIFVEVSMTCKVGIFDVCNVTKLHHHKPRRTKQFLYFQKAGDIERMTISRNDMLMEISLVNGSLIHENRDGFVEIRGANNESITVNMSSLEVTACTMDGIGKQMVTLNVTEEGASFANGTVSTEYEERDILSLASSNVNEKNEVKINSSCAVIVFRKVFDAQAGIGAELRRKHTPNVDVHIRAHENTTVYERRDSDEVYLIANDSDLWEEMYIQPTDLVIRTNNHLGILYFHEGRPIHVNGWNGTRVSGSPFGNKFAKVVDGNATRQVTFATDGCGRLEVAERSGSRKLIAQAYPPMLFIVDDDNTLKIEPRKHLYSNSSRGVLKVDFEKPILEMKDFANGSIATYHPLLNETNKWAFAAGSVEHFPEGAEERDYFDEERNKTIWVYRSVSSSYWRMNVSLGSLDFPASGPIFQFVSANKATANVNSTSDGFWAKDAAGEMIAHCRHFTNLVAGKGSVHVNGLAYYIPLSFLIRNEPGSVDMLENEATVRGHSGMVIISPFKIPQYSFKFEDLPHYSTFVEFD